MNDLHTEEKIFAAAEQVFEENGLDGTRMQDIANKAGINKALLHYYFRTKDLLFDAVFQKLAKKMLSRFSPVLEEGLTLEEKIRFFFREHISFLQDNPRLPGFLLNEINRNPERIKMIISHLEIEKLWATLERQHRKEFEKYNITVESLPQIMTTIAAISVFPFAAKGLLEGIFEKAGVDFNSYIEERKVFAGEFVINALKNSRNE